MKKPLSILIVLLVAFCSVSFAQTTVKVFLLGGQSNMLGWNGSNTVLPAILQLPQTNVQIKVFGGSTAAWGATRPGLGKDVNSFGPEVAFAWDISKSYAGETVAIIKGSWANTTLHNDWRPPSAGRITGQGVLYDEYVKQVNIALGELKLKYTNVIIEGMCWMQGESDADTQIHANEYEANLKALINDFRADFKSPTLPFVLGMIDVSANWIYNASIRATQIKVAQTVNKVSVFDTKGYSTDGYHYYTSGQLRLGADFAMVMKNRISPDINTGVANFYQDCSFVGKEVSLGVGSYTLANLVVASIPDNYISSVKMMNGFKTIIYKDDNYGNIPLELLKEDDCIANEGFNDVMSSLKIKSKGVVGLAGVYNVKNSFSGQYLDLNGGDTAVGISLIQWPYNGGLNQQFELSEIEEGVYKITCKKSNKVLDIDNASKSNGMKVIQWNSNNGNNQKYIFVDAGNGYYNIIPKHSGIALEVSWDNSTAGAVVTQRGIGLNAGAKWKLESVIVTELSQIEKTKAISVYPNPFKEWLYIDVPKDEEVFVSIYNLQGELVLSNIAVDSDLDVHFLQYGMYIIEVTDINNTVIKRELICK